MTRGDGMAEGLGRMLAVRTKQEAADVTLNIPPSEHVPGETVPVTKDEQFDPTISDVWRAEDLGVRESENVPRETVDDAASRVLQAEETRQLAACCDESKKSQSAPETKPTLEARPVSTNKRRNPMKWRASVLMLFAVAIGCLYGINSRTDERVDILTAYYIEKEYGPAAMQGKTCLEVTAQVKNIGIAKFVPIAQELPYTDAATLERLFAEGCQFVGRMRGSGDQTVVELRNWYDSGPLGLFGKKVWGAEQRRSVLIHPHPASVGVYANAMEDGWHGYIYASDFDKRKHYGATSEGAMRVANYAATAPLITHAELAELGDMKVMHEYENGVLYLVNPYGAGERFVRLSFNDYNRVRSELRKSTRYDSADALKDMSWRWWDEVRYSAIKEEQTAAK